MLEGGIIMILIIPRQKENIFDPKVSDLFYIGARTWFAKIQDGWNHRL